MGTPNREPQEYSRNIMGIYLLESLHSIIFLLYSWGSLFGVPSKVPLLDRPKAGGTLEMTHCRHFEASQRSLRFRFGVLEGS